MNNGVGKLVSIIIPTFNRCSLLGETLDSIISQTYANWECIVIDDGSNDYTQELMEFYCTSDHRFQYYKRPSNLPKGANACRNYGFKLSKAKYINFFDSDDLMHPKKLELQVDCMSTTNVDFTVCESLVFLNNKENILGKRHAALESENPFRDFVMLKIGWLTQAPLFDRTFLENLDHLFDEELQAAQEWEFYSRILAKNPTYHVINKGLVYLRKHSENLTYGSKHEFIIWNYFLARLKIFRNQRAQLDHDLILYLRNYLLGIFKNEVWQGHYKQAFKIYTFYLLKEDLSILKKLYAVLAIISFKLTGKGTFFLRKIKFL